MKGIIVIAALLILGCSKSEVKPAAATPITSPEGYFWSSAFDTPGGFNYAYWSFQWRDTVNGGKICEYFEHTYPSDFYNYTIKGDSIMLIATANRNVVYHYAFRLQRDTLILPYSPNATSYQTYVLRGR